MRGKSEAKKKTSLVKRNVHTMISDRLQVDSISQEMLSSANEHCEKRGESFGK